MEVAKPHKEHEWLQKLVGEWRFEPPGKEPGSRIVATESVRSIGELWIQAEARGNMPDGQPFISMLTLGYDPDKRKFVGTWLGSMMTYLWIYEGSLDGNVLTLDTTGPSFTNKGEMARYQEIIDLRSPDHRVFTSLVMDGDGKWNEINKTDYWRTK